MKGKFPLLPREQLCMYAKPEGVNLCYVWVVDAFKCVKTHGAHLGRADAQHHLSVKCYKHARMPACRHINGTASILHGIRNGMADRKLAACNHNRNRNIPQHKAQHRSGISHCVRTMNHDNSVIQRNHLRYAFRKPFPVLRKNIRAVHGKQVLHFQLYTPRYKPQFVQQFLTA